jgi:hypothetical protein
VETEQVRLQLQFRVKPGDNLLCAGICYKYSGYWLRPQVSFTTLQLPVGSDNSLPSKRINPMHSESLILPIPMLIMMHFPGYVWYRE